MIKAFFPVNVEDAKVLHVGSPFNEPRGAMFRTTEFLLSAKEEHSEVSKTHPIVVELKVPEHSVIEHPDFRKISLRKNSGAVISRLFSWDELSSKKPVQELLSVNS